MQGGTAITPNPNDIFTSGSGLRSFIYRDLLVVFHLLHHKKSRSTAPSFWPVIAIVFYLRYKCVQHLQDQQLLLYPLTF